jgi:hypothetical protein
LQVSDVPPTKTKEKAEFGDFQTPQALADQVCALIARKGLSPSAIVEPTCGIGMLLCRALDQFPQVRRAIGSDINPAYVEAAQQSIAAGGGVAKTDVLQGDFFATDWPNLIACLPEPLLVIGNPPWVTNAELGMLGSANLPPKQNFQQRSGIEAITGKSNFDISEWMLLRLLEWLSGREAVMAMLCKTAVARKVLVHAWQQELQIERAATYRIDAARHFHAAVDACLLYCSLKPGSKSDSCSVYDDLETSVPRSAFGYQSSQLVADIDTYKTRKNLLGRSPYRWRSGIKHDCARVMELTERDSQFNNGFGESVQIENDYLYPMRKSSEVARGAHESKSRWMLVTQQAIGDDTSVIQGKAPQTWRYLHRHAELLARRKSTIYRGRPPFSIFGVGSYSFAPWKVAISGFYKSMSFARLGSVDARPIVLDDTSYFLPCRTRAEMIFLHSLLGSDPAQEFLRSLVFWDAKRPITIELLSRLDLGELAKELGRYDEYRKHVDKNPWVDASGAANAAS